MTVATTIAQSMPSNTNNGRRFPQVGLDSTHDDFHLSHAVAIILEWEYQKCWSSDITKNNVHCVLTCPKKKCKKLKSSEIPIHILSSLEVFNEFDGGTMLDQVSKFILGVCVGVSHLGLGLNCSCNVLETNDFITIIAICTGFDLLLSVLSALV